MGQSNRITEPTRSSDHDRLRLTESLLRAIADNVSSLQRLLHEVQKEIDVLLRDAAESNQRKEVSSLRQEVEQLREGLASRAVIERAKGIIMQGRSVAESEAFDLLNELSQRQHRKLREIAADVVSGQLTPIPGTAGELPARPSGATTVGPGGAAHTAAAPVLPRGVNGSLAASADHRSRSQV